MTEGKPKITDWKLEQFVLEELPAEEMRAIAKQVESDIDVQQRLAVIRSSNEEILAQYTPHKTAVEIQWKADRREAKSTRSGVYRLLPAAASLGILMILVAGVLITLPELMKRDPGHEVGKEIILYKGLEAQFSVFQKGDDKETALEEGTVVKPGDELQLAYLAVYARYGAILSIDGAGMVTRHFPQSGEKAAKLSLDGRTPLDFAYELDDAPGFERFFFIFAKENFELINVMKAAQRLAGSGNAAQEDKLKLAGDLEQRSLLLLKSSGEHVR